MTGTVIAIFGIVCFLAGSASAIGGLGLFMWAITKTQDDQMAGIHGDVPGAAR